MTYDPSEKELSTLNEGRLMRAEADVILPLLTKQREAAVTELVWRYKEGKLDQLPQLAAKLATIEDMKAEITNRIKKAESIERKVYAAGSEQKKEN